jgi:hypothetical protein
MARLIGFAAIFSLGLASSSIAATINVPADYSTIQDAINAAQDGDTVLVAPGTYIENIDFKGKRILVTSAGGSGSTTIDGSLSGSVVTFQTNENQLSILEGFTITRGLATRGGGIICTSASPVIRENKITGNFADQGGAGIFCDSASFPLVAGNTISANLVGSGLGGGFLCSSASAAGITTIADNVFDGNSADLGGGIFCDSSAATISGDVFTDNVAFVGQGGAICLQDSSATIVNSVFLFNQAQTFIGGGIASICSTPDISQSTFYGNSAAVLGGGLDVDGCSAATVADCILWANSAPQGAQISGTPVVRYSDVMGGFPGQGNIDLDPLFEDVTTGDLQLQPSSPCVDQGDPATEPPGRDLAQSPRFLDGDLDRIMIIDMGCYEFANIRLEATGSFTPGGTVTLTATGTPGLSVFLFVATAPGEALVRPFGPLFFDLAFPWIAVPFAVIPGSGSIAKDAPIPPSFPVPSSFVLQQFALNLVGKAGNCSNSLEVVIQ